MNKKTAITLIELIIAISLMSVVVLGAISFDSLSRKIVNSSERKAVVANDLTLALDYLQKSINYSVGTAPENVGLGKYATEYPALMVRLDTVGGTIPGTPPIAVDGKANRFYVRYDNATNPTPSDFSDDVYERYSFCNSSMSLCQFMGGNYTVALYKNSQYNIITSRLTYMDYELSNGCFKINNMTLRYDPYSAVDNATNPEVSVANITFCSQGCALN